MPEGSVEQTATDGSRATLRESIGLSIWTMLVIVDALVLTRRVSGQFVTPIPPLLGLVTMSTVAAFSWLAWTLTSVQSKSERNRYFSFAVSLSVDLVWLYAISANGSPFMFGVLLGIVMGHAVVCVPKTFEFETLPLQSLSEWTKLIDQWQEFIHGFRSIWTARSASVVEAVAPVSRQSECSPPVVITSPVVATNSVVPCEQPLGRTLDVEVPEFASVSDSEMSEAEPDDENQTLWLSRQFDGGGELIEGWVRVAFSSGQRETQVHVAFCPPMAATPEIETEDLDGVGLEVRTAAAFPFGARLSVRRSESLDEDQTLRVGFAARAQSLPRAA